MDKVCYFHHVEDPNEVHYDEEKHHICLICGVKLWEIAQTDLAFEIRDQTVELTASPAKAERVVELTGGYPVQLSEPDGLQHLFNAVLGEVLKRQTEIAEPNDGGFRVVYEICICELHFVAGQLRHMGSSMDIVFLLDEFGAYWDDFRDKVRHRRKPPE